MSEWWEAAMKPNSLVGVPLAFAPTVAAGEWERFSGQEIPRELGVYERVAPSVLKSERDSGLVSQNRTRLQAPLAFPALGCSR